MRSDVIVIGAGIHGCSVAMQLAIRGAQVVVAEKTAPAAHASGANAGSVHHIARLVPELPLAELALRTWHSITDLVDADCGFQRVGHLKIAKSEEDMRILETMCAAVKEVCGIRESLIDGDELRRLEPHVAPDSVGGVFSPDCGYALPANTVNAFRAKAERLGVRFLEGEGVEMIRRAGGIWTAKTMRRSLEAPVLVNCAGAWGDRFARQAGDDVGLAPMALQMVVLARMPRIIGTVIALTQRHLSIKQLENGTVVIGGGYRGRLDLEMGLTDLDIAKAGYNLKLAAEAFPGLVRGQVVRCWAGIEGRSPDGVPIIGPGGAEEGIWHAFGFSARGFYLGPAVGGVLADLITGREPEVSLAPFDVRRFTPKRSGGEVGAGATIPYGTQ